MKNLIILLMLASVLAKAQTTIYVLEKGVKDPTHFMYFDHATGKVYKCWNCKSAADKERDPGYTIKIEGNQIFSILEDTEKKVLVGKLKENNKIVTIKHNQESPDEYNPSIKGKKIVSASGEEIGLIEGKPIYGATAYIIGLFR